MSAPKVMDRLGVGEVKTFGDLGSSHKIIHVELPSHG